jgi:hypothetical protein
MRGFAYLLLLVGWPLTAGCGENPTTERKAEAAAKQRRGDDFALMKSFRGTDLRNLGEKKVGLLVAVVERLVPGRKYSDGFDYVPWRLWEFSTPGAPPLYVLCDVDDSSPHPGSTSIRLTLFGSSGRMVSETTFTTGHRCYLDRVELERMRGGDYPVVILATGDGPGPGPGLSRQIYAMIDNTFSLVRLQGHDGKATRNRYYVQHFACGPAIPQQTELGWELDLTSNDRWRILRALTWLGGIQLDAKPGDDTQQQQESLLSRAVHKRAAVSARLGELMKDSDPWIREAAELARKPQESRFD